MCISIRAKLLNVFFVNYTVYCRGKRILIKPQQYFPPTIFIKKDIMYRTIAIPTYFKKTEFN